MAEPAITKEMFSQAVNSVLVKDEELKKFFDARFGKKVKKCQSKK